MEGIKAMEWFCKLEFYMMMFYMGKVILAFILVVGLVLLLMCLLNLMYESLHRD